MVVIILTFCFTDANNSNNNDAIHNCVLTIIS